MTESLAFHQNCSNDKPGGDQSFQNPAEMVQMFGRTPQPTQANDHLSKDCFDCIWQRCCSIHNGHWGSSPDPGGCCLSYLMRRSVDARERPVRRPDLPIRRLTGSPSSQRQLNTKQVQKAPAKAGAFCVQIPVMTRSPAIHQNCSNNKPGDDQSF